MNDMTNDEQAPAGGPLLNGVVRPCPECGSDCNERDELTKAEREIERLRGIVPEMLERLNDELCAENEQLRAEIADAVHTMRAYARENPRHEYQGATQDPNGVHAWLERNDRA